MVTGINHITWNVVDIDNTFDFYVNLLGLKPIMKSRWSAYFLAGTVWIAITKGHKRVDDRYDHIALNLDKNDYADLVEKLKQNHVTQWKTNKTEGESFYFFDPSGNKFELHYSSLDNRVQEGKANWGNDVTWYV